MLHHRTNTPNFCFHFTGKEKDPETGYSYFGARYLEHELMTMWLSVDPMADKYPNISPYAYCAWNPLKLVDPKGKEIIIKDGKWRWYYYIDGHVYLKTSKGNILMDSKLSDNGKKIKGNLDEMSQHKSGKKVVDRLTKSKEKYFISINADKANGHYDSKIYSTIFARIPKPTTKGLMTTMVLTWVIIRQMTVC